MDFTSIVICFITAVFSGSGLIATIINNRSSNKQSEQLEDIRKSIALLKQEHDLDSRVIDELSEDVNALTLETLSVDKALTSAIAIIIDALEKGHINGEGLEAKKLLDDINAQLQDYRANFMKKIT